jgi:hypothetical protein
MLIVLASLAAFAPVPVYAASRAWTEVRSAHFRVVSTDAPAAQRLAQDLETFRAVLERRGHNVHLAFDIPVLVVLADGRDFAEAAAALSAPSPAACGFAVAAEHESVILVDRGDGDGEPRGIAYRGYVQLVLDRSASTPAWFREGLAEYYRTFAVDDGRVLIGRAEARHLANLRYSQQLAFDRLLTLDRTGIDALPPEDRSMFASQSWALVHSRFSAGYDGKRQLARLMGLQEAGVAPDDAVRDALGTDVDGLGKQLRQYVKQRRHTYTSVVYDDLVPAPPGAALPVMRDDVFGELALARDEARELISIAAGPALPTAAEYPLMQDPAL